MHLNAAAQRATRVVERRLRSAAEGKLQPCIPQGVNRTVLWLRNELLEDLAEVAEEGGKGRERWMNFVIHDFSSQLCNLGVCRGGRDHAEQMTIPSGSMMSRV